VSWFKFEYDKEPAYVSGSNRIRIPHPVLETLFAAFLLQKKCTRCTHREKAFRSQQYNWLREWVLWGSLFNSVFMT